MRLVAVAVVLAAMAGSGAPAGAAGGDVTSILRASRAALGLDALPKIHTLHFRGNVTIAGIHGTADAWQDVRDGRFAQSADAGPVSGGQGYDGAHVWNRDASGIVWDDDSASARTTALDAAYLNRYLLWAPDRGGASVASSGTRTLNGKRYDVLRVTPRGSLPFDLWIDAVTHLPARMIVEVGLVTTKTDFDDYRSVRGVRVPFVQNNETDGGSTSFTATVATADDPASPAALRRPVSQAHDFALPSGTTTIPFELIDNHVGVPVTIDGKGPFRFIFDTGGSNVIDSGLAKELGLGAAGSAASSGVGATTEEIHFATVRALGVGEAMLRDQVFAVAPVRAGFGISSSKPVDGLIGFEVLARFVTTFDYATNQVVLRAAAAAASAQPAGTAMPFVFNGQHVQIPCTIQGFAGPCIVDTGSRVALTVDSPFIARHPTVIPPNATAPGTNGYGIGGASRGRLGRTTLQIDGFTIPDVITDLSVSTRGSFADPFIAGNIGAGVWKRFGLTLDYAHRTMMLAPNADFATRETYDRSGTFLIARSGKIVIVDVRPGTPAAKAGIASGDAIVTIDGKDAGALGLATLRDRFREPVGTTIALTIATPSGTTRTTTITLADYV